jgi:hypothetical protein
MMSYVLFRIAITIAIMVFVVLASIYYHFFSLTAIMLIALALLDDVPIMTITFDNASVPPQPVKMGVGSCVSNFVCAGVTWSYSKLWPALPGRHSSSPRPSTATDYDVPPARSRWSSDVIRDSYPGSFMEATLSKRQAFLCDCRDSNRRDIYVQPRLAGVATFLEYYRFCLGLQRRLDHRAGRCQTRALWNSGPGSFVEEIAFPATSGPHDTWTRGSSRS